MVSYIHALKYWWTEKYFVNMLTGVEKNAKKKKRKYTMRWRGSDQVLKYEKVPHNGHIRVQKESNPLHLSLKTSQCIVLKINWGRNWSPKCLLHESKIQTQNCL